MHRLPLELRFLVFEEMGRDSLRNCSLVSKSWRNLCLPALFRELEIVNILSIAKLHACSNLLTNAPNLRPYIRKVTFCCNAYPVYVDDEKHGMVATILSDLPGLDELNCPSILSDTLSFVLPHLSITKLSLVLDTYSPPDPLPVLEAVASTLRSLTLQDLGFGDQSTVDPVDPRISNAPICMIALEDLAVVSCVIALTSKLFRLPVLKTLYCEGEGVTLGDAVPSSLKTLVVVDAKTVGNFELRRVDNLCIRWRDEERDSIDLRLADTVERVVSALVDPSKIKHIEALLPWSAIAFRGELIKLDWLESYALDLHWSGSLERLSITVENNFGRNFGPDRLPVLSQESVSKRLPVLGSLGLLDVRIGHPSILYPRCTEFEV